jgi:outer membrane protein OmpA-like peptidoglycan-associated protein
MKYLSKFVSAVSRLFTIPICFRQIVSLISIFLLPLGVAAQKITDLKKNGEKFYTNERWNEALTALAQYQEQKPGDAGVLAKLGIIYFHLNQAPQARKYLEYILQQNLVSNDPLAAYYLARTYHLQQEYERAIEAYKVFLRNSTERHPLRASIPDQIRRCMSGMQISANDQVALVENLGEFINTPGDEFAPIPSVNHNNRLYFSAARPGCTGGPRDPNGFENLESGRWCSDMFVAQQKTSGWEFDTDLGALLNTARNEVILDFNSTGKVVYFFRGYALFSGDMLIDTAGVKDEYSVESPVFKGPVQMELGDVTPYFFNDSTLLFASRISGSFGGADLYVSSLQNNAWSIPLNLGPNINTPYDEICPFLARDGKTLYFSSNHTGTAGGFDVFKSVYDPIKKQWSAPISLGLPINSPGDDTYFRLSKDGKSAFFASNRIDSYGERDLYQAYFKEPLPEQDNENQQAVFAIPILVDNKNDGITLGSIDAPVLPYETDKDILSPDNLKSILAFAQQAIRYPETTLLVTVHTHETGPAKFDLYNGIKRAEIMGKQLTDIGVPPGRILLRSVGAAYPIAKYVLDAAPNPFASQLNRRIALNLVVPNDQIPVNLVVQKPAIAPAMLANADQILDDYSQGLSYKVELATTRQILNNDALAMFTDLMIESQPGSGAYRYTAGWSKSCQEALKLRTEILKQGFTDAAVVAYINGVRISKAEAVSIVKKYPDLVAFIKS